MKRVVRIAATAVCAGALLAPWFVPYYVDVGTGNSDLTWQAIGGLGYAFKWGESSSPGAISTTT